MSKRLHEALSVALLAVLGWAQVWSVRFLPTQDGPVHVYIASMLANYNAEWNALARLYLEPGSLTAPNVLIYCLLVPLDGLAAPETAERLVLSLYVLLFVLAAALLGRALGARPWLLPLLAFPAMLGFPFQMGFYNYCLGLALALLAVAAAVGALRGRPWLLLPLGLLSALAYFAHIFAAAALLLVLVCLGVGRWRDARPGRWRDLLGLALAAAPVAVLAVRFALGQSETSSGFEFDAMELALRAGQALMLSFLYTLSIFDFAWSGLLALALLVLLLASRRVPEAPRAGLGLAALAFLALLLLAPRASAGSVFFLDRLLPYAYLCFAAWLAARRFGDRLATVGTVALLVFAVLLTAYRAMQYQLLDVYLAPARAASAAVAAAPPLVHWDYAIYPLPEMPSPILSGFRVRPLQNLADYALARTGGVDLSLYQLHTRYFPLHFRQAVDPFPCVQKREPDAVFRYAGPVDFACYKARVDRIVVAGDAEQAGSEVERLWWRRLQTRAEARAEVNPYYPLWRLRLKADKP